MAKEKNTDHKDPALIPVPIYNANINVCNDAIVIKGGQTHKGGQTPPLQRHRNSRGVLNTPTPTRKGRIQYAPTIISQNTP